MYFPTEKYFYTLKRCKVHNIIYICSKTKKKNLCGQQNLHPQHQCIITDNPMSSSGNTTKFLC